MSSASLSRVEQAKVACERWAAPREWGRGGRKPSRGGDLHALASGRGERVAKLLEHLEAAGGQPQRVSAPSEFKGKGSSDPRAGPGNDGSLHGRRSRGTPGPKSSGLAVVPVSHAGSLEQSKSLQSISPSPSSSRELAHRSHEVGLEFSSRHRSGVPLQRGLGGSQRHSTCMNSLNATTSACTKGHEYRFRVPVTVQRDATAVRIPAECVK